MHVLIELIQDQEPLSPFQDRHDVSDDFNLLEEGFCSKDNQLFLRAGDGNVQPLTVCQRLGDSTSGLQSAREYDDVAFPSLCLINRHDIPDSVLLEVILQKLLLLFERCKNSYLSWCNPTLDVIVDDSGADCRLDVVAVLAFLQLVGI